MNIGQRIKKCREALGLSQEELAQKLGYKSRSTINKIEAGINDITQSKVAEFAHALDTTPAYLMGWDTTEPEDEDDELEVFMLGGGSTIHKIKKAPALSEEKQELIKIVKEMDDAQAEALLKLLKK